MTAATPPGGTPLEGGVTATSALRQQPLIPCIYNPRATGVYVATARLDPQSGSPH